MDVDLTGNDFGDQLASPHYHNLMRLRRAVVPHYAFASMIIFNENNYKGPRPRMEYGFRPDLSSGVDCGPGKGSPLVQLKCRELYAAHEES